MSSKFSLLIGNSEYKTMARLTSPVNDIESLKKVLDKAGYYSICRTNLALTDFKNTIREFCERLINSEKYDSDIGIFYFAGHGIQIKGGNHLCPIDMNGANLTDSTITVKDREYTAKKNQ